ncbi:hypothetical protein Tco_0602120 [Tanacetum coccineum]
MDFIQLGGVGSRVDEMILARERSMGAKQGAGWFLVLAGRLGKKGLYKLGCDRERLKMIKGDLYKLLLAEIMAAPVIAIPFDSSDESMGSPPTRVILFGDIPTVIPSTSVFAPETSTTAHVISSVAPVVETAIVASPTGFYGLVPYSNSDSDSHDEMDSPEDSGSSETPPSYDPYVAAIARWRSRVTTRSSSPSDFPPAPVTAPPGTRRRATILIRSGEAIPLGRLYRTHPNGPRRVMTPRKRVRPLPAHRLARRHVSPRATDHHSPSASSSSDHSPVHSSGFDTPDQAHSGSLARVAVPRLVYPPVSTPRYSEAFHRWRASPLSTVYPPTTSESSSGDSSSERSLHLSSPSVGPSRKRSRSPVDSVPSSSPAVGSLALTRADILPPHKRFRYSYSSEASMEEDIEVGTTEAEVGLELAIGDEIVVRDRDDRDDAEEYEADTSAGGTIEVGIDPRSMPVAVGESEEPTGGDSSDSSGTKDGSVRSVEDMQIDLGDAIHDFYHHMSEIRVDRVVSIEATQRQLEVGQMIAGGEHARMDESISSLRLENLKVRALLGVERDCVDSLRLHMSRSQEEFRQIRDDRDDLRRRLRRLRRLESFVERRLGFRL